MSIVTSHKWSQLVKLAEIVGAGRAARRAQRHARLFRKATYIPTYTDTHRRGGRIPTIKS